MTFNKGLELVSTRKRLLHAASGGGMAAAVRIEAKALEDLLAAHEVTKVDIVNRNSPTASRR